MSIDGDLTCGYRRPHEGLKRNCGCGDRNYTVSVFRCTHPECRDFCTLSRYSRYQPERICQFCQLRTESDGATKKPGDEPGLA